MNYFIHKCTVSEPSPNFPKEKDKLQILFILSLFLRCMRNLNKIIDQFRADWSRNNEEFEINEPFPDLVVDTAIRIKDFMKPENRVFQGALGNAKGMMQAVQDYAKGAEIENLKKMVKNIEVIFDFLLKVRTTSQVPLNTTFFITQKLKKLNLEKITTDELQEALLKECEFHISNYEKARNTIAEYMCQRIIDRCQQYDTPQITIGTHCHSGAVVQAMVAAKDYVRQVIVSKTEPEQQGILTAEDLCKEGVPVNLINLEQYGTEFRKVNVFLFGIDAVSVEGIVLNKAGTRLIATLARTKEIPVYFLGETYKYARQTLLGGYIEVERRNVQEQLLHNHLGINLKPYVKSGLLHTDFSAFDTTRPELYNSIVSENGFLPMREAFEKQWEDYL